MDPQLLRSAATVADYGYDAPYALVIFAVIGAAGAIGAIVAWREGDRHLTAVMFLYAVFFLGNALSFFYTTRRGKFVVWNNILDRLHVRGDEHVLDMGCGRGAVLIAVARRLTSGRVIGIDLWSTRDQSGNANDVTRRNASLEGVVPTRKSICQPISTFRPWPARRARRQFCCASWQMLMSSRTSS